MGKIAKIEKNLKTKKNERHDIFCFFRVQKIRDLFRDFVSCLFYMFFIFFWYLFFVIFIFVIFGFRFFFSSFFYVVNVLGPKEAQNI